MPLAVGVGVEDNETGGIVVPGTAGADAAEDGATGPVAELDAVDDEEGTAGPVEEEVPTEAEEELLVLREAPAMAKFCRLWARRAWLDLLSPKAAPNWSARSKNPIWSLMLKREGKERGVVRSARRGQG